MSRLIIALALSVATTNALADYTFPPFDVAVTDEYSTIALDVSVVPATLFAGYRVELAGDFSDPQDPVWRLRTDNLPIPLADPGKQPYPNGGTFPAHWEGAFPEFYHGGDPLYFDVRATLQGSQFNFTDITITLVTGRLPTKIPPPAQDLGTLVGDGVGVSTSLDSNGVRWFRFSTDDVLSADCAVLRVDTLDSLLSGGAYLGGNDPVLALYNRRGMLLAQSDDIDQLGGALQAALAFGVDEGAPVASSGELPADAYYLAVAGFGTEFRQAHFGVAANSRVQGTFSLNLRREIAAVDCNNNGQADACDISQLLSDDINTNGVPDECEDCNDNDVIDEYDLAARTSRDCNRNSIPDECDIAEGNANDCNANGVPDACELISAPHNCCEVSTDDNLRIGCSDANIQDCVFWRSYECGVTSYWGEECVALVEDGTCGWCERSLDENTNGIPDECDGEPLQVFVPVIPRQVITSPRSRGGEPGPALLPAPAQANQ